MDNRKNNFLNIRSILLFLIISFLLFPFDMINISFKKFLINDILIIDIKMVIVGIMVMIFSIINFIYIRKNSMINYLKSIERFYNKLLIASLLIILSSNGFFHPVIPIVIILIDIINGNINIVQDNNIALNNFEKINSMFLIIGIILKLFGNFPFEFINISIDDFFIILGTILSFILEFEYNEEYKKHISNKEIKK